MKYAAYLRNQRMQHASAGGGPLGTRPAYPSAWSEHEHIDLAKRAA